MWILKLNILNTYLPYAFIINDKSSEQLVDFLGPPCKKRSTKLSNFQMPDSYQLARFSSKVVSFRAKISKHKVGLHLPVSVGAQKLLAPHNNSLHSSRTSLYVYRSSHIYGTIDLQHVQQILLLVSFELFFCRINCSICV